MELSNHDARVPEEKPKPIDVGTVESHLTLEYFDDPARWSVARKTFIVIAGLLIVFNSTLNSSLPSGAASYIGDYFNVSSKFQLALLVSMFLIGYVLGPTVFSPLSELYGRRIILTVTFTIFMLSTLACALSNSWPLLLSFRLIAGICASAPITVVSGVYSDIFPDPETRGRALTLNLIGTTFGPVLGPTISGFIAPISWRWTFWISLAFAGFTCPFVIFHPETYHPVLLERHSRRDRSGLVSSYAQSNQQQRSINQILRASLSRPFILFTEPIIFVSCTFLALEYAIYYLFFEAYPIIFQGICTINKNHQESPTP